MSASSYTNAIHVMEGREHCWRKRKSEGRFRSARRGWIRKASKVFTNYVALPAGGGIPD